MENVEIERKFLVVDYRIIDDTSSSMGESLGTPIVQGYLDGSTSDRSVRVRVTADQATLTLKGPREGAIRIEYETGLPLEFGLQLLDFVVREWWRRLDTRWSKTGDSGSSTYSRIRTKA